MALSIKDPETARVVRELTRLTGESEAEAVRKAVVERLEREREQAKRGESSVELLTELLAIARHCRSLPVLDDRSPDEILGYDEHGLPR